MDNVSTGPSREVPRRRDLGQIEEVEPGVWYVRVSAGRDPITGARRRPRKTVKGTRRDAERVLAEMSAEFGTGFGAGSAATVGVYLKTRYLPWVEDRVSEGRVRRATFETYSHELLTLAAPLHDIRLDQLDPWTVDRWLAALHRQGLGGSSRSQAYGALRRALRQAVKWQVISSNVTDRVDRPKAEAYQPKILTVEEAVAVLQHFRGHKLDLLVHLALGGGLRRSENIGLRWECVGPDYVDIQQGYHGSRLGVGEPKSRSSRRRVPLPAFAVEALDRAGRQETGWLHTETGARPLDPTRASMGWREHAAKIGIDMPLKDLRHSCGTLLLEQGTELLIVSKVLGHSTTAITQRVYVKPREEVQRAAMARLDILGGPRRSG